MVEKTREVLRRGLQRTRTQRPGFVPFGTWRVVVKMGTGASSGHAGSDGNARVLEFQRVCDATDDERLITQSGTMRERDADERVVEIGIRPHLTDRSREFE